MDVSYFTNSSGAMQIYTTSGQVLLDSSVHQLSFTSAGSVSASASYASGGLSGISLGGTDITSQIKSGSIAALVTERDDTLPAAQSELDQMAVQLADTLNDASNAGTADPPPNSLTGTTTVSAGDQLSATGTFRVAVTDSGAIWSHIRISTSRTIRRSAILFRPSTASTVFPPASTRTDMSRSRPTIPAMAWPSTR